MTRDVLRGGQPEPFDKEGSDVPTLRAVMEAHDVAWQRLVAGDLDPMTVVIEHEAGGYETHAPLGIRLARALYHGADHRSPGLHRAHDPWRRAAGHRGVGLRRPGRPHVHDPIEQGGRTVPLSKRIT